MGEHNFKQNIRSHSNNRSKKEYFTTQNEIKEQNIENKRNILYAESKIQAQIINDKIAHKAKQKKQLTKFANNNAIQYKNNDNNSFNYGNQYQPETQIYYYKNKNGYNEEFNEQEEYKHDYSPVYNNHDNYINNNEHNLHNYNNDYIKTIN